jgi:hypothetical protein
MGEKSVIDRRTGEVWYFNRKQYRSFATKSQYPNGPIFRIHSSGEYGMICSYSTYARRIKKVNKRRKKYESSQEIS